MKSLFVLFPLLLFVFIFNPVKAQSSVTFNINLKPQLQDSLFLPGKDKVEVSGNLLPFRNNQRFELKDEEPIDSIYTVSLDFSAFQTEKELIYNFILQTQKGEIRESRPRVIKLKKGDQHLDALYFNAFAF